MGFDAISACYALSVAAGGIIGYIKAGIKTLNLRRFNMYLYRVCPCNLKIHLHIKILYFKLIILIMKQEYIPFYKIEAAFSAI